MIYFIDVNNANLFISAYVITYIILFIYSYGGCAHSCMTKRQNSSRCFIPSSLIGWTTCVYY